jgi:cyanophycinase-like exopeptidase
VNVPLWWARHPALEALLELAVEEARERGHHVVEPAHLALALTREKGAAAELIRRAGAEPRRWRDYVNYVLGENDGVRAAELQRVRPGHLKDVVQIRYLGPLAWSDAAQAVLEDALQIAGAGLVDHRHVLAAFFDGHGHIAAGTARFMRLSAQAVRQAGGLPPRERISLPDDRTGRVAQPKGKAHLVLLGSCQLDQPALRAAFARAPRQSMDERGAVLIDSASPEPDGGLAKQLSALLGTEVRDSGLRDRDDAFDPRVAESIRSAAAIFLDGGSVLRLYSTLSATPALEALVAASDAGAVLVACSAGAQLLGRGCLARLDPDGGEEPLRLLGWLGRFVIHPHCSGQGEEELLRRTLAAFQGSAGLGIAHRGAVVVHPGWQDAEEIVQGWDGGSFILNSHDGLPKRFHGGRLSMQGASPA